MNQIGAKHEAKRLQFTRKNLRKKRRKTHRSKTKNEMIINTKKRQRNGNTHQPTDTYEIVPIVTYQLNGARPVKKIQSIEPSYRRKTAHSL